MLLPARSPPIPRLQPQFPRRQRRLCSSTPCRAPPTRLQSPQPLPDSPLLSLQGHRVQSGLRGIRKKHGESAKPCFRLPGDYSRCGRHVQSPDRQLHIPPAHPVHAPALWLRIYHRVLGLSLHAGVRVAVRWRCRCRPAEERRVTLGALFVSR